MFLETFQQAGVIQQAYQLNYPLHIFPTSHLAKPGASHYVTNAHRVLPLEMHESLSWFQVCILCAASDKFFALCYSDLLASLCPENEINYNIKYNMVFNNAKLKLNTRSQPTLSL